MDLTVENVLLYVDDAVRYDALIDELSAVGPTYKTVAASTHTPTSFGSLLTGLLPPRSGIHSFKHTVPEDVQSIFDLSSHHVSIAAQGGMNHSIADIFGNPPRATLDEIDPPFIHVLRRPGGHAPYDRFNWDSYEYEDMTALEYFWDVASSPNRAREEYFAGVKTAYEEFQRLLSTLDERGLRENTLVIYTSDHGEMLGEYGFFGHTHMATPEVVYVPTTFIHPDLTPGQKEGLFHHVDLLATIGDALEQDTGRTDGTVEGIGRTRGYTHLEHVRYGSLSKPVERLMRLSGGFDRTIRSLWDENGGHVFVDGSPIPVSIVYLGLLTQKPFGKQVYHCGQIREAYDRFMPGHQSYGSPAFGKEFARSEIDAKLTDLGSESVSRIDDRTTEHLENMGYL